ncbi:MAG: pseudouridine synthase [Lachnospiraceae bacterium]|nr:pseudouridine synthase [Lachnospiraceae bacterium]
MPENDGIRLNKFIASAGICSRRDADKLIEQGKVTLNGKVAKTGDRVLPSDSVKVGSRLIKLPEKSTVIAFYKPVGVTCTERDEHAELTIYDVFKYKERMTYAGRLDKDSEGLLIMTNDGDLIDSMMRAKNNHEKEYVVEVNKYIPDSILEKMAEGVYLNDLKRKTKKATVKRIGKTSFAITLTEGMNREIRRMCANFDYKVVSLKRVRVLNVTLGGLKPGQYRVLNNDETTSLKDAVYGKNRGKD